MGASCPSLLRKQEDQSLPVFNMVVVGFKNSGKTSIIARLGTQRQKTQQLDNSLGKSQLGIGSFVLQRKLKIVTFQVSSSIVKTWKRYYPNANILLIILDSLKLSKEPEEYSQSIEQVLKDIDKNVSEVCKIIVIFNKVDQIQERSISEGKIVMKIAELQHQVVTLKCSAVTGEGIDKLSKSILSIHKKILF